MRILSGIQPSGVLHIGNYFGAVRQWIELQNENDCFFMVADLHAITVPYDKDKFKETVRNAVLTYLAIGLDPKKCSLFVQSHIPEHTELMWLLNTITPLGELERMTQFKEKKEKQRKEVNAGLLNYPILQAADILLYHTDAVPVGRDQVQHIEFTRMLAKKFNTKFGELFHEPKELLPKFGEKIMSLTEPTKKMSKSDAPESYISLLDDEKTVMKKIKTAVTDSGKEIIYDPKHKPAISNLLTIYHLFSGESIPAIQKKFEKSNYAQFKEGLADVIIQGLASIQEKRKELEKDNAYIENILKEGEEKARAIAQKTLREVKEKMGINS